MIHSFFEKSVVVLKPQSLATSATATGNIDTKNCRQVTLDVMLDSAGAVSSNPPTLKISESADTVTTNFADITAFVGDGVGGFTIPDADTASPQIIRFNIDTKNRKRYLKLTLTPAGATQLVGAVARLGRKEQTPITASGLGVAALVSG